MGPFGTGPGGLAARAPVLAAFFTFAIVATIGVPGTSGFAGEFLVLAAAFVHFPGAGLVAVLVVIAAAVYGLGFLRAAFFGPDAERGDDLRWPERALLIPLVLLVLVVGLAPRVLTDVVTAVPDQHEAAPR